MPFSSNIERLPIPDNSKIWGEFIAPPHKITSLVALYCISLLLFFTSAPIHCLPSNNNLVTRELVIIVRFFER